MAPPQTCCVVDYGARKPQPSKSLFAPLVAEIKPNRTVRGRIKYMEGIEKTCFYDHAQAYE